MRFAAFLVLAGSLLSAGEKRPIVAQGSNAKLSLDATAITDRAEIKQLLGSDFDGAIVVLKVKLTPKGAEPLKVFRDDFLLRSYKDGQKSTPFAPSQLAGKGQMVISTGYGGGGGVFGQGAPNGPGWGTLGGGRPQQLPGDGSMMGNSADPGVANASIQESNGGKEDPLLAGLKKKIFPEKETIEPLEGLLYFPLDGKHKAKDLALAYNGAGGKLLLEFKQ